MNGLTTAMLVIKLPTIEFGAKMTGARMIYDSTRIVINTENPNTEVKL